MKLTVIVTVYNEVNTIIQAIKDVEKIKIDDKEVIIFDNDSTDGTKKLLKELKTDYKIVYNDKNINSGSFVKALSMARGEYLYVHHTDLEYDPIAAMDLLRVAEAGGYDVVLGSRLKNKQGSKWDIIKERPAYLATILCTSLLNLWYEKKFTDMIGSRIYRTEAVKKIPIGTIGFGFEFEFISRICKYGLQVTEIAVPYEPRSWQEGKKIRPYHLINALFAMFKVRYFEPGKIPWK
ncbi:MAG: glycosyltransferase family 2 protein [bacterium]